jgi:hypothetical protein
MNLKAEGLDGSGQDPAPSRIRERLTTWASFALLLIFFIFTIAVWGYAAWRGIVKLIGLVF